MRYSFRAMSFPVFFVLGAAPLWLLACEASAPSPGPQVAKPPETRAKVVSPTRTVEPTPREAIQAAVSALSRSDADRALDAGRHPRELLEFFQVASGQTIAELAAGGGYTAELVARVVGDKGRVLGQNSPFILSRFAEKPWSERLAQPWMSNVTRLDTEFDAPFPAQTHDLDAVLLLLFYHDTVWMKTDRAQMNAAIFRALRPGGIYGVVDHSAREGSGLADVESLHRIEQSIVMREIEAAGFVLEAEADFLRNPSDTRDWSASPRFAGERRGTSDRFALRFRKPKRVPCSDPRPSACSDYPAPVCAEVDSGVRCITTPCPSTSRETFKNACQACQSPTTLAYERGACR